MEFEARSLHRRINRSSFLIDTDRKVITSGKINSMEINSK